MNPEKDAQGYHKVYLRGFQRNDFLEDFLQFEADSILQRFYSARVRAATWYIRSVYSLSIRRVL